MLPSQRHEEWVLADQGKPGLERTTAIRRTWLPTLTSISRRRGAAIEEFLLELAMPAEASSTTEHNRPVVRLHWTDRDVLVTSLAAD